MASLQDLSDDDLLALKAGDLSKVSDSGLLTLKAMRGASDGPQRSPQDNNPQLGYANRADEAEASKRSAAAKDSALFAAAPAAVAIGGAPLAGTAAVAVLADLVKQTLAGRGSGSKEPVQIGEALQQGVVNSIPVARGPGAFVKNVLGQAAAGLGGEEMRSAIDEGKASDGPVGAAAAPAALAAVSPALAKILAPGVARAGEAERIAAVRLNNANKDPVLTAMQKRGAVVIPSSVNPSSKNRFLESIAGIENIQNEAARRNAPVFADIARSEAGIPGQPINRDTLDASRKVIADRSYNLARESGQGDLLNKWRDSSTKLKEAEKTLDRGYTIERGNAVDAAQKVRDEAEKALSDAGLDDVLKKAKVDFAKTYDVGDSVASGTDEVRPAVLSQMLNLRGEDGLTGGLRDIAQFNNNFSRASKMPNKVATAPGAAGTGLAANAAATNPAAGAAMVAGNTWGRGYVRDWLLSPRYQAKNAVRDYSPRTEADPAATAAIVRTLRALAAAQQNKENR